MREAHSEEGEERGGPEACHAGSQSSAFRVGSRQEEAEHHVAARKPEFFSSLCGGGGEKHKATSLL